MDAELVGVIEEFGPKISRGLQWHMAPAAILLCFFGIVEAPRAVARDAAEQIGVVRILAPEEVLVLCEFGGETHLMAGGAEFRGAMERLEERFLVKLRLGLDQLFVHETHHAVRAESKWIVDRFLDGVVRIAARAVDV